MRECRPKRREERERARACGRERERPGPLAPLFICFFLPLGLLCVNWASQECCFFYLKSSLQSSDLPLFYFHGLFPSLSFSHRHSGLLFPILTTYQGWSHSRRSGIWWSRSFEKIGASEITGCHLGNLVSLKDHCDLFFVCEVDITSHLINEIPCGPYQA